jgi:hypothetical protein
MLNKSDFKYQYSQSCERLPMDELKVAESVLFESRKESKSTRGGANGLVRDWLDNVIEVDRLVE